MKSGVNVPNDRLSDSSGLDSRQLQAFIGREVRNCRRKHEMTATELAHASGISPGMLSKIEKGTIAPSLGTLQSLSWALAIPITTLLRSTQSRRTALFTKCMPPGITNDFECASNMAEQLASGNLVVHKEVVTLTQDMLNSGSIEYCSNRGRQFIFILDGELLYRHGDNCYLMSKGDSLQFDAEKQHGPESVRSLMTRYLSVLSLAI